MNKQKANKFQLKNQAIAAILCVASLSSFAQQAPAPAAAPVATNPFGSVPPTGQAPAINYNAGSSNIDGNKQVVNTLNQAPVNPANNIMNPAQAQQQMNVPMLPPAGLPQQQAGQQQTEIRQVNGGGDERTNATRQVINILNADKERIREINRDLYEKGRVINEAPVTPPKSVNDVIVAHLSPGSTAPVIRLSKNRTTSIILTDSSGQPWPIVNYDGLSDEDFTVRRLDNPAPDGYVLSITPKAAFASGNLTVVLKGLPTPVNIEFVSAQKIVDGTTQIRVQAFGPNSQFTSLGLPSGLDNELLNVLQGVGPVGSKELQVSSKAVQAWLGRDGSMYVRTRYKVMAPAFEQVTSSPDGTYAYKMIPVDAVLFKAGDGKFGEFTVQGY